MEFRRVLFRSILATGGSNQPATDVLFFFFFSSVVAPVQPWEQTSTNEHCGASVCSSFFFFFFFFSGFTASTTLRYSSRISPSNNSAAIGTTLLRVQNRLSEAPEEHKPESRAGKEAYGLPVEGFSIQIWPERSRSVTSSASGARTTGSQAEGEVMAAERAWKCTTAKGGPRGRLVARSSFCAHTQL